MLASSLSQSEADYLRISTHSFFFHKFFILKIIAIRKKGRPTKPITRNIPNCGEAIIHIKPPVIIIKSTTAAIKEKLL